METTDIKAIVNAKIESMLDDGILKEKIEKDIEQQILNSLSSAVSDWDIKKILTAKLKDEISEDLNNLSFKAYTNKVIEAVCNIIKIENNKDLTDRVKTFYGDLFEKQKSIVPIQEIIDKYIEVMKEKKKESCCYDRLEDDVKISISYNEEHDWYNLEFKAGEKNLYRSYEDANYKNEHYFEMTLAKQYNEKAKYYILTLRGGEEGNKLTNQFSYRLYNEMEKYLLNLYLNKTVIKISEDDVCEEEYDISEYYD